MLDSATRAVLATIPIGPSATALAADPATNRVYAVDSADGTLVVIDATTNTVIGAPIDLHASISAGLAVDATTNRIYAGDADGNTVATIDGSTNTVFPGPIGIITVGNNVAGLAVDPLTHHLYVTNAADGTVIDVDTSADTTAPPIAVGSEADQLVLDAASHRLYVVNSTDSIVSVIDTTTDTQVGSPIPVGNSPQGIAVNQTLHHVYVANQADNTVSVIDGATNTVLGTIATAAAPSGLAVDEATGNLYATLPDANEVQVLSDPFIPGAATPTGTPTATATPTSTPMRVTASSCSLRIGFFTSLDSTNGSFSTQFSLATGKLAGGRHTLINYLALRGSAGILRAIPITPSVTCLLAATSSDSPPVRLPLQVDFDATVVTSSVPAIAQAATIHVTIKQDVNAAPPVESVMITSADGTATYFAFDPSNSSVAPRSFVIRALP